MTGKNHSVHFVCCANDDVVLERNLLSSPIISSQKATLTCLRGKKSAAAAYAEISNRQAGELLCFIHQDVYLPAPWQSWLLSALERLQQVDPSWAVLGCYGVRADGTHAGHIWDSGWNRVFGSPVDEPILVSSVDEVIFCINPNAGNLFDPELPDFHLYGTDVVQFATNKGLNSYVAEIPVVHNSRRVVSLRGGYAKAYSYMQRKWRDKLPLPTTIVPVTRWGFPLVRKQISMLRRYGWHPLRAKPSQLNPKLISERLGWEKQQYSPG